MFNKFSLLNIDIYLINYVALSIYFVNCFFKYLLYAYYGIERNVQGVIHFIRKFVHLGIMYCYG